MWERLLGRRLQELPDGGQDPLGPLRRELRRDGYVIGDSGEIRSVGRGLPERALASLQDASAIEDHLGRLVGAADSDPARAIGSAKELIESTAKVVLRERGVVFNDKADVPELVKAAQESLGLHAGQHVAGPDGTPAVKRILGGLSSIALGVMELRNAGYGTGHGQVGRKVGLSSRHAHLAVNAATTWCRMMLDTLQDPKAPWTKQQVTPEP